MQWRILNDRRTILSVGCDKLAQKDFIARALSFKGLQEAVKIPEVYWVGTDVRELAALASRLPERWVLKPNHSSGRVRLLDAEKHGIEWEELIAAGDRWLQPDEETIVFGHSGYSGARRLIIAEERIGSGGAAPDDLRLTCCNGRLCVAAWSRGYGTSDYQAAGYRPDLITRYKGFLSREAPATVETAIDALTQDERVRLITAAQVISQPFDHVRVDFYFEHETLWFSELTVYSNSGLMPIEDRENLEIGSLWQLPDLSASDPREAEWRALLEGTPKGTLQR